MERTEQLLEVDSRLVYKDPELKYVVRNPSDSVNSKVHPL